MIYAKFMPGRTLAHASRNRRELEVAKECGYDILVVSSDGEDYINSHFQQYHYRNDGTVKVSYDMNILKRHLLILWGKVTVIKAAKHINAEIVSCHDLDSLWIFWLSQVFCKNRPKLVYDAHEFELGRNKKRSRLNLWWVKHLEKFLMKRCALSIMVNDVIADEVKTIHKLKERPLVVRNIPNYWDMDAEVCKQTRQGLLQEMNLQKGFVLMYHGGVTGGRGIEMLLKVVSLNNNVCAVVLGNADRGYLDILKALAQELQITNRVLFKPAVQISELWKYVGAADVGMVTIPAVSKSYYYMLPNKFFENVQALTPVICSDYPAIQPIVGKYGIGLTCDPNDVLALNDCVERMRTDSSFYNMCINNLSKAKEELCWEKEKIILKTALLKLSD